MKQLFIASLLAMLSLQANAFSFKCSIDSNFQVLEVTAKNKDVFSNTKGQFLIHANKGVLYLNTIDLMASGQANLNGLNKDKILIESGDTSVSIDRIENNSYKLQVTQNDIIQADDIIVSCESQLN